ncbi:MAG: GNAT family N-acetyltransferase [Bizionia sp.]|nr:GNAT family N-acetyltransferase [Bizionia sp.]
MKFTPFPELKTERLLLRKIETTDCDVILFLRSDETVNAYIERPESRKTKNKADALKFIEKIEENLDTEQSIAWGITLQNNPQIIGTICLWNFSEDRKTAEVGYDLNPKFHKKGIMSEALKATINYGFNSLNLNKIEAFTHKNNESSKHLLEKNGFKHGAHRKDLDNNANFIFERYKAAL